MSFLVDSRLSIQTHVWSFQTHNQTRAIYTYLSNH